MLYKNKYHRKSIRKPAWDYSTDGLYFITFNTKRFNCLLGQIVDKNMQLSEAGEICAAIWQQIPDHFPFAVLDEFMIMPDHIHGIIGIKSSEFPGYSAGSDCLQYFYHGADNMNTNTPQQSGMTRNSLPDVLSTTISCNHTKGNGGITKMKNPMLRNDSISAIIRWFKGRVSHDLHQLQHPEPAIGDLKKTFTPRFQWQPKFHDHIIRNETELDLIRAYIKNNPRNWGKKKTR